MLRLHNVEPDLEATQMHRLPIVVFSLLAPTLMGVFVVVALVFGVTTLMGFLGAAAVGAAVSIPLSMGIARALEG